MSDKLSKFATHGQGLVCERPRLICTLARHAVGDLLAIIRPAAWYAFQG